MKRALHSLQRFTTTAVVICAALSGSASAQSADSFPDRPIHLIVTFAAGGGMDTVARVVGERLSERLGQPVVVENMPGANGDLAAMHVAEAEPDGYTLLVSSSILTVNPSLFEETPYDPVEDFTPVAPLVRIDYIIVVNPSLGVKTLQDLIDLARERPGELDYASGGVGTPSHLTGELIQAMAGVEMVHIPYQGGALGIAAVVSGEVDFITTSAPAALPHIEAGTLDVIAVTSPERADALPDVPSAAESGLPGFDGSGWYGLLAPAGTSADVVGKINTEVATIVTMDDLRERFAAQAFQPFTLSPDEFRDHIATEFEKWSELIEANDIRGE